MRKTFQSLTFFLAVLQGWPLTSLASTITGTVTWRGAQDKKDAVVYLEGVPGEFPPAEEPHEMNQREKVYIPHVLPILKGEQVKFMNNDPLLHNVHVYFGRDTLFNLAMIKSSRPLVKTFDRAGEHVVLCDVHPEMEAWIIVLENPYFAVTDENGNYKIENVPTGTHTLKVWHKKLKSHSENVTVNEAETSEVNVTLSWP
ncbi:MAG: hypothetical protein A3C36_05935 [Omnitrophica WOR_2 bacterium RIFCSPHIGHO2_02_FULL_52_10]|nr:MAG: hypothetical protein A3C36_05935 [Omnitrophica WOR_2 bacterium RIFCSPHIGHO2_02_FULL_52_10]